MTTQPMTPTAERPMHEEADFVKINAVDHVEVWVCKSKQCVFFL